MKGIYLYMTMCMAAMTFTSCTNDLEESFLPTETLVLTAFSGHGQPQDRCGTAQVVLVYTRCRP